MSQWYLVKLISFGDGLLIRVLNRSSLSIIHDCTGYGINAKIAALRASSILCVIMLELIVVICDSQRGTSKFREEDNGFIWTSLSEHRESCLEYWARLQFIEKRLFKNIYSE